MSDFLVNLARRGAGLPANAVTSVPRPRVFSANDLPSVADVPLPPDHVASEVTQSAAPTKQDDAVPFLTSSPATSSKISGLEVSTAADLTSPPSSTEVGVTEIQQIPETETYAGSMEIEQQTTRTGITALTRQLPKSSSSVSPLNPPPAALKRGSKLKAFENGKLDLDHNGKEELATRARVMRSSRSKSSDPSSPQWLPSLQRSDSINLPPEADRVTDTRPREDLPMVHAIRPAVQEPCVGLESSRSGEMFRRSAQPTQTPIHVRIGRIEVRSVVEPPTQKPKVAPSRSLGFAPYFRLRTYRNWPR